MQKQLKIKLLPNGEIKMETIGIKGKSCLKYVDMLEKLADAKIKSQEFTKEYYEQENANINTNENLYE